MTVAADTETLTLAGLLGVLDYGTDEFVSVCHQVGNGGPFKTAVMAPTDAQAYVDTMPREADVWFGVNPTTGPARRNAGRGGADDVTRLAALYADLDVYGSGPGDLDAAHAIIAELSGQLGVRPSVIVSSGHGLHPYWPIDRDSALALTNAEAKALLARFGRLVTAVARHHDCEVDSVFNLDRVLRVPGTRNHKAQL